MDTDLFQKGVLEEFVPISLELYLSEYDIEIEGSLMISGVTSRFQFLNGSGGRIQMPKMQDKVLAYSFFLDQGDEWQDVLDKLSHYKLIDSRDGKIIPAAALSSVWTEQFGFTATRFERLSKLVDIGVRPVGAMRRRHLAAGKCLSLGMTLTGSDDLQRQNYSNMFFTGCQPSKYLKVTINDIYFSAVADSEAPTLAAFETENAPVFLYSDPKLSLLNR